MNKKVVDQAKKPRPEAKAATSAPDMVKKASEKVKDTKKEPSTLPMASSQPQTSSQSISLVAPKSEPESQVAADPLFKFESSPTKRYGKTGEISADDLAHFVTAIRRVSIYEDETIYCI